jgi:hypothetical protein
VLEFRALAPERLELSAWTRRVTERLLARGR